MNPEIKQRIEQIRCGEQPEGYKKTKAGILPADWNVHILGDCLSRVERPVEVKSNVSDAVSRNRAGDQHADRSAASVRGAVYQRAGDGAAGEPDAGLHGGGKRINIDNRVFFYGTWQSALVGHSAFLYRWF